MAIGLVSDHVRFIRLYVCTDEKLRGRFTRVLRNFGRNFVHTYGHFATSPGNSIEELADN